MAVLEVVWRNPNRVQPVRCWAHIKRGTKKSVYLVLESAAAAPGDWKDLPALEILHGRALGSQRKTRIIQRFLAGS